MPAAAIAGELPSRSTTIAAARWSPISIRTSALSRLQSDGALERMFDTNEQLLSGLSAAYRIVPQVNDQLQIADDRNISHNVHFVPDRCPIRWPH